MTKIDVYLGLGSNVGDRELALMRAMTALDQVFGTAPERISRIVETPAWGFEGPDFLNCVVCYRTAKRPHTLLDICKRIERAMGRTGGPEYDADGRRIYHDRPIDIDILLYGDERVDDPDLKIPHPLMEQRDFVMRPLREILPQK